MSRPSLPPFLQSAKVTERYRQFWQLVQAGSIIRLNDHVARRDFGRTEIGAEYRGNDYLIPDQRCPLARMLHDRYLRYDVRTGRPVEGAGFTRTTLPLRFHDAQRH